ncbi:MAG: hypothetical protein A2428_11000 [Bdellovibrionales bacterium RIFOXYC1_FULL_54_43]|nr:MAG: hypothetical protein A2428_11000 [Bdellovibrionales bacterium RIFOXYC1_FULL_54_43]HLD99059.1 CFI-box-CTERM domain-containing protein [Bdellovibrionota bacterium]
MPRHDDVVTRAKRKVQRQIEEAEREHRKKLMRRRIELATSGLRAYQSGKIAEAAQSYQTYLRILEDWKGVPPGGLTPALFDVKKDMYEVLLISAIYWDLTKMFDRTRSPAKQRDFMQYMEKYILFSKGMPFQPLATETLRKYISNEKAMHKPEFKNAYKMLGGDGNCFVATALTDVIDPGTLPRLRTFRDRTLSRSRLGRGLVGWYYRNGPKLARWTDCLPQPGRKVLGSLLDVLSRLVA